MALIEAATVGLVGYYAIDDDHQEFVSLLNQLDVANNADFPALFRQLFEHTEQHFARENQLMQDYGFPAEDAHKGEHMRILGEFKQFQSKVDKGMVAFGRLFVREVLPQWFMLHTATMDNALAAYMRTVSNVG